MLCECRVPSIRHLCRDVYDIVCTRVCVWDCGYAIILEQFQAPIVYAHPMQVRFTYVALLGDTQVSENL